jgi:Spy/CpxP family protein refolding chaperone
MNRFIKTSLLAGVTALALVTSPNLLAQQNQGPGQGPGQGQRRNFDPAQMQQRMLDRMKETLGVTSDDEWKVISERLTKVMTARRESAVGFGFGGRRGAQGGGPGGPGGAGAANPAVADLEKAIESGSANDIKTKLAALREYRVKKQAELKAAQEELKKVLSPKQEAQLVSNGMLD